MVSSGTYPTRILPLSGESELLGEGLSGLRHSLLRQHQESRCAVIRTVGSNPTLSAITPWNSAKVASLDWIPTEIPTIRELPDTATFRALALVEVCFDTPLLERGRADRSP
jgi:hypothetical protein